MAKSATRSLGLVETSEFVGMKLRRNGFARFHNGGIPSLERRRDDWIEEIVFRPAESPTGEDSRLALRVTIHLGNTALQAMRARYWEPISRAPLLISSADLGELDIPPRFRTWPPPAAQSDFESICQLIEEQAIPWFRGFRDDDLVDRLVKGVVPLVDTATALELALMHGGPRAARQFLEYQLTDLDPLWKEMDQLHTGRLVPTEHLLPLPRIAKIAAAYRLLD